MSRRLLNCSGSQNKAVVLQTHGAKPVAATRRFALSAVKQLAGKQSKVLDDKTTSEPNLVGFLCKRMLQTMDEAQDGRKEVSP